MMEYTHQPVLAEQVIEGLQVKEDGIYADGTLGGGGHGKLICERLGEKGIFLGIDRDADAIEAAENRLHSATCKILLVQANFADIRKTLIDNQIAKLHGAVLDLGVSSWQLDNPARGFSYMRDGPLDMRMDGREPLGETGALTAKEIVNTWSAKDLAHIIRRYGEERWATRIAAFIVKGMEEAPIETTEGLTEIIKSAIPAAARREGPHPAKRTFQAIRIAVNEELEPLGQAVNDFIDALDRGGRLAVITFHSLEDRIVKEVMRQRENPCTCPPGLPACVCGKKPEIRRVNRKPMVATDEEKEENPRARSAKLRIAEKI